VNHFQITEKVVLLTFISKQEFSYLAEKMTCNKAKKMTEIFLTKKENKTATLFKLLFFYFFQTMDRVMLQWDK